MFRSPNRFLSRRAARRLAPELLLLESRELLSSFTVTKTDDSGPGSLRQEIMDADAAGDGSVINFQIPGTGVQTIAPLTDLPAISAGITIDGTTQPGASANTNPMDQADNAVLLIELSGANGSTSQGLQITGDGAAVHGLVIDHWCATNGYGFGLDISGQNVTIAGNFIGSDPTGNSRAANGEGIRLDMNAANFTLGGTSPADRNVIAGNDTDFYSVPGDTGIDNVKIVGNFIGVDAAGDAILVPPTDLDKGLEIYAHGTNLTIGGTTLAERNVIDSGVDIDNRADVLIQGNFFDTDITGTTRVAVDLAVVYVEASSGITVGGTASGEANVFATGFSVPNGSQAAATGLVVQGNFFGTDPTGTIALGTGGAGGAPWGIDLGNAIDPLVGGTNPGEGNVIANVQGYGILSQAQRAQILGNSIYANTLDGLYLEDEDAGHVTGAIAPHMTVATPTEIDGSYTAGPGTYRIEFFSSPVQPAGSPLAASDELQGQTFLGFKDVTIDASGVVNFTFTPSAAHFGRCVDYEHGHAHRDQHQRFSLHRRLFDRDPPYGRTAKLVGCLRFDVGQPQPGSARR